MISLHLCCPILLPVFTRINTCLPYGRRHMLYLYQNIVTLASPSLQFRLRLAHFPFWVGQGMARNELWHAIRWVSSPLNSEGLPTLYRGRKGSTAITSGKSRKRTSEELPKVWYITSVEGVPVPPQRSTHLRYCREVQGMEVSASPTPSAPRCFPRRED